MVLRPPSSILSAGTLAEGEYFNISERVWGRFKGMTTSSNGCPVALSASQGLRLQLDQFFVPRISV